MIAAAASQELDQLRKLSADARGVIAGLQARYAAETGIKSLKIQHNNILGFFIEVNAAAAEILLDARDAQIFLRRQTLANSARFTTDELAGLEARIHNATEDAHALERALFDGLVNQILEHEQQIMACAAALAGIDCAAALAELAAGQNYCRPMIDDSTCFRIEGGRHPVVEQAVRREGETFIANDCRLGGAEAPRLLIVTGPNMAGKSTYLRQNALIAVLAQMGSFVPAASAHIGVVDCLFSRVGASDELARGRSTFMVEMVETAAILNLATQRSLVILDEIGRGTATFDGLSIAWAALEHLHDVIQCRGLFATHYHELTRLPGSLPYAANISAAVKDWKGGIVFLHAVQPGPASRSYGIQVAKLAGVPSDVIYRARQVLTVLERGSGVKGEEEALESLPLFRAGAGTGSPAEDATHEKASAVIEALAGMDPEMLSPREALDALYRLKLLAEAA